MDLYRTLYFKLFSTIADAVELLEHDEPLAAKKLLIAAMQAAEEAVIKAKAD